ncbi:hypothetical protein IGM14_000031 [Enterococcus sp. DIV2349]|uniref:lanthionine synthetase LanC family protein n=1 Tax=Enterococcus TaxID=1350 RepID=UPI00032E4243|nr:lanthionine synthetase LanC family protein [Enterococcus faecalis]EGO8264851.1 hypothetical protein [Enterococcus faecalis]EHK9982105.1 hypothetical protein [Enterococcus faecalis]EJR9795349.1 hypothetical protein [Enterococcus faecalis]EJW9248610.1 hypothetical protein [Enterococcus faecalis]EOJ66560.1 hypothetical protein WMM_00079 [Enterococcus faecalis EnGen0364]
MDYEKIINQCELVIKNQTTRNINSYHGLRDYTFFLSSLIKVTPNLYELIEEKIIRNTNSIDEYVEGIITSPGLWHGLSSYGYLCAELNDNKNLQYSYEKKNQKLSNMVELLSKNIGEIKIKSLQQIRNHKWFDIFYGVTGIIVYLFRVERFESAKKLIYMLTDSILLTEFLDVYNSPFSEKIEAYFPGKFDRNSGNIINLDVSHGILSVFFVIKEAHIIFPNDQRIFDAYTCIRNFYVSIFNVKNSSYHKQITDYSDIRISKFKSNWARGDLPLIIQLLSVKDPLFDISDNRDYLKKNINDRLLKEQDDMNFNFCNGIAGVNFQLKIINQYFYLNYFEKCVDEKIINGLDQKIDKEIDEKEDQRLVFKTINDMNIIDGSFSIIVPKILSNHYSDLTQTFIAKMFCIK